MSVSWRDKPVRPGPADDIGALVALARKARAQLVDFDWVLSAQELRRLREAVHSWGVPVRGRYKRFDAQILAAINEALGEPNSAYSLPIPKDSVDIESFVNASAAGEDFRLQGCTSPDVIFGYSSADANPSFAEQMRRILGDDLLKKLKNLGAQLGWDVERFREPNMAPVVNALYNLPLDYNGQGAPDSPIVGVLDLEIHGPYCLFRNDECPWFFESDLQDKPGVYVLTIPAGGAECVHYVGQTSRSFNQRLTEHLSAYLSGRYRIVDPDALAHGKQEYVWKANTEYGHSLTEFLAGADAILPKLHKLLRSFRCHVILEDNKQMLDRIEGALGRYFRRHENAELRQVFGLGAQFPSPIPGQPRTCARFIHASNIAGMPPELVL